MLLALSNATYVLIGWFKFLLPKFLYEYWPRLTRLLTMELVASSYRMWRTSSPMDQALTTEAVSRASMSLGPTAGAYGSLYGRWRDPGALWDRLPAGPAVYGTESLNGNSIRGRKMFAIIQCHENIMMEGSKVWHWVIYTFILQSKKKSISHFFTDLLSKPSLS